MITITNCKGKKLSTFVVRDGTRDDQNCVGNAV